MHYISYTSCDKQLCLKSFRPGSWTFDNTRKYDNSWSLGSNSAAAICLGNGTKCDSWFFHVNRHFRQNQPVPNFRLHWMLLLFEFGINNFASDLREEDDNRIIQVTQNLAGAGWCSAKKIILLLEDEAACDQHRFFSWGQLIAGEQVTRRVWKTLRQFHWFSQKHDTYAHTLVWMNWFQKELN